MEYLKASFIRLIYSEGHDTSQLPAITSTISFIKDSPIFAKEKPYRCAIPISHVPGAKSTNIETETNTVEIRDIRGHEDWFSFWKNGFELFRHKSNIAMVNFDTDERAKQAYLDEVSSFVKSRFEASKVIVYSCARRDNSQDGKHVHGSAVPINYLHIDHSPEIVVAKVKTFFPKDEAEQVLRDQRVMIVKVWRPLDEPVRDMPLGIVDNKTVSPKDAIAVDDVKSDGHVSEDYSVKYTKAHKFYYVSDQRKDECWLLFSSFYDPKGENLRGVPHAAFQLPNSEHARPRQSVEVGVLVIF